MTINFYNNSDEAKRVNKSLTLILSADGEIVKDSSILHPRVRVQLTSTQIQTINYAYIPVFNRYYYVSNPVWLGGNVLEYTFDVDPLMSHKTGIYSSSGYVLRCSKASEIDADINDGIYSMKSRAIHSVTLTSSEGGWIKSEGNAFLSDRRQYVVVLRGARASSTSGTTWFTNTGALYLVATLSEVSDLLNELTSNIWVNDDLDKIADIFWLPFQPSISNLSAGYISFGGTHNITLNTAIPLLSSGATFHSITFEGTLSPHINNDYRDTLPYRKISCQFLPFGTFELDSAYLYGEESAKIVVKTNVISGVSTLYYCKGSETPGDSTLRYLGTTSLKISKLLSVQGSLSAHAASSILKSTVPALVGAGIALATGGASAVGMSAIGAAMGGTLKNATSEVMTFDGNSTNISGNTNSIIDAAPVLLVTQYEHTQRDITKFGAPCCKPMQLSTLQGTGFCQCSEIDLSLPGAYDSEYSDVEKWLQAGVYL